MNLLILVLSPEPQSSQVHQQELVSLEQNSALQLQSAMTGSILNLYPQQLFWAVPILNQEMLLGHKGLSTFLHPQQVGESLRSTQEVSVQQN